MCDWRGGARTSAGHRVGVITERLSRVSPRGGNPFWRSQSRRIDAHAVARELHGNEEPLASSHSIGGRFSGLLPKIKAHHWAGVTLSMKNMLGVVPGARYGWPKNILHWKGIQESILDVCATIPVHFVIADGIVAMQGNGPLNGTARTLGKIVLADDPVAADTTCARLMGFEPDRVVHIREGAKFLGNLSPVLIDQVGEIPQPPMTPFQVVPEFGNLYAL